MENIKREELISAYLDGELDAIEAARTEQWIAEDPRAKKLFNDVFINVFDSWMSFRLHLKLLPVLVYFWILLGVSIPTTTNLPHLQKN